MVLPNLPSFNTDDRILSLMQSSWAQILNSLLKNPSLDSLLLKDINLVAGDNIINHRLGRTPQGWRIVDATAASTAYRSAPFNDLTLTLNASAPCVVAIEVF